MYVYLYPVAVPELYLCVCLCVLRRAYDAPRRVRRLRRALPVRPRERGVMYIVNLIYMYERFPYDLLSEVLPHPYLS